MYKIVMIVVLLLTFGCSDERLPIPDEELIPVYTVFEEKEDGSYCTDRKGWEAIKVIDDYNRAYTDRLKEIIRDYNER